MIAACFGNARSQVFFTISCIVSAFSLGMKCQLFASKLRSRFRFASSGSERAYDLSASAAETSLEQSSKYLEDIQTKLEANKFTRRRLYAYFLLATFEDAPMSVLNFLYLARSVLEVNLAVVHTLSQQPDNRYCAQDCTSHLVLFGSVSMQPSTLKHTPVISSRTAPTQYSCCSPQ